MHDRPFASRSAQSVRTPLNLELSDGDPCGFGPDIDPKGCVGCLGGYSPLFAFDDGGHFTLASGQGWPGPTCHWCEAHRSKAQRPSLPVHYWWRRDNRHANVDSVCFVAYQWCMSSETLFFLAIAQVKLIDSRKFFQFPRFVTCWCSITIYWFAFSCSIELWQMVAQQSIKYLTDIVGDLCKPRANYSQFSQRASFLLLVV
jgi:hypothetical protein